MSNLTQTEHNYLLPKLARAESTALAPKTYIDKLQTGPIVMSIPLPSQKISDVIGHIGSYEDRELMKLILTAIEDF